MDRQMRTLFNGGFSQERHHRLLDEIQARSGVNVPFRIAETPVFMEPVLMQKMLEASREIFSVILKEPYLSKSKSAVPVNCLVPGYEGRPTMLALDFAVAIDKHGNWNPQLIELQGFPSLFYYQHLLGNTFKSVYPDTSHWSHLFCDDQEWLNQMYQLILNGHSADDVILLELDPRNQNTYIDFSETSRHLGIDVVCLSELFVENGIVYRWKGGQKLIVKRIYNRVIFDELLQRPELIRGFDMVTSVDVEWVCHPNWYFRISKYALPHLHLNGVPHTIFADDALAHELDLSQYVLKPLFSFSGQGVMLDVDADILSQIKHRSEYILQKRIDYAPCIETPDGFAKAEIRLMFVWTNQHDTPMPMITLARLSKGAMVGVKYNKDKTWVGSSIAFWR
jgi:hypothetical protein